MTFTVNSTVAEIMARPDAKTIIDKHAGRTVDPAQLQMAKEFPLWMVARFIGWSESKVEELLKDLNA